VNTKLVFILAIACGILTAVIVAEWGYALNVRKQALSPAPDIAAETVLSELPSLDLAAQPEESFADFVERPLFISGRRPVVGGAESQPQAGAVTTGQFDWQLVGVYTPISGEKLQALFAREKPVVPKDNFRKLAEGAFLDGWQVTQIDKNKATLTQEGNQKVLHLNKPKPKLLPAGGAPPPKPEQDPQVMEPEEEPLPDEEFIDE